MFWVLLWVWTNRNSLILHLIHVTYSYLITLVLFYIIHCIRHLIGQHPRFRDASASRNRGNPKRDTIVWGTRLFKKVDRETGWRICATIFRRLRCYRQDGGFRAGWTIPICASVEKPWPRRGGPNRRPTIGIKSKTEQSKKNTLSLVCALRPSAACGYVGTNGNVFKCAHAIYNFHE